MTEDLQFSTPAIVSTSLYENISVLLHINLCGSPPWMSLYSPPPICFADRIKMSEERVSFHVVSVRSGSCIQQSKEAHAESLWVTHRRWVVFLQPPGQQIEQVQSGTQSITQSFVETLVWMGRMKGAAAAVL